MTLKYEIRAGRVALIALATGLIALSSGQFGAPAFAAPPAEATPAAEARKPNAPPSAAEQALNRGIAAYQKNAMARAVGAFSSALSSGGLDTQRTARALYYRGLAYRKQGRTALAITDLTNALWLKNGLTETERADATSNRASAYREAGIADPGAPVADPAPAAAAPVTVAAATPASSSAVPAPIPQSEPAAAPRPPRTAVAPEDGAASGDSSSGSGLGGIGSFFSNLFSGGSSSPAPTEPQPVAAPAQASDLTTASTGGTGATSSWNSGTVSTRSAGAVSRSASPAPAAATPPKRTAALAAPAVQADATPPASVPKNGKYKLQLAAVRSRADAEALAQRFTSQHGGKAGGRTPVIEEAVFGNMGTFYRVNIGPYASAAEPEKLCSNVRGSGFDCLVVTH